MTQTQLDRRQFLRGTAGAGLTLGISSPGLLSSCSSSSDGSEVVIRMQHDENRDTLTGQVLRDLSSKLKRKSDGDVKLEITPAAQLSGGDIKTMINQTRKGAPLDAALISSAAFASFEDSVNILSLPFLCAGIDDLRRLTTSGLGDDIRDVTKKQGLVTPDIWVRDLRQWVNTKGPIQTPSDIEGMKFRVPRVDMWVDAFEAVGALPTPMAFEEAFTAVQTGSLDGAERPLEFVVKEGWADVCDYLTLSDWAGDALLFAFNEDFWAGLPSHVKKLLQQEIRSAGASKYNGEKAARSEFIGKLEEAGMEVNRVTGSDRDMFREAMSSVWEEWASRLPSDWFDRARETVGAS